MDEAEHEAEHDALRERVLEFLAERETAVRSTRSVQGHVRVHLSPESSESADLLLARFPSGVEVVLGFKSYPAGHLVRPLPKLEESVCPDFEAAIRSIDGSVMSGARFSGEVQLTCGVKVSSADAAVAAGPAWICRVSDGVPLAGLAMTISAAARHARVGPHEVVLCRFVGGTESLVEEGGYYIAPGKYLLMVPVRIAISDGAARLLARLPIRVHESPAA